MEKNKIHYAWWIFLSCCAFSIVTLGLVGNTMGLFFAPLGKELHFTKSQISMILSLQGFAGLFSFAVAGKIIQKVEIRLLLTISFIISGVVLLAASTFNSIYSFYVMGIINGLLIPILGALTIPVLLGNWFEQKLGTVLGISAACSAFGGAVFNPLVSNIITNYGWRKAYIIVGVLSLLLSLPFTIFVVRFRPVDKGLLAYGANENVNDIKKQSIMTGISAKKVFRLPSFYLFCLVGICLNGIGSIVQHISGHVVNAGYTLAIGASVMSGVMIGAAIGKVTIGYLLDKFNNTIVLAIYALIGALGWFGLFLHSSTTMLIGSGFALGVGQAVLLVSFPFFLRMSFGIKEFGNIFSVISMVGSIASSVVVYISGALFDATKSFSTSLIMNCVFYGVAFVAMILAIKSSKKVLAEENKKTLNA